MVIDKKGTFDNALIKQIEVVNYLRNFGTQNNLSQLNKMAFLPSFV